MNLTLTQEVILESEESAFNFDQINKLDIGEKIIIVTSFCGVVMIFLAGTAIAQAMLTAFITTSATIFIFYSARETYYGAKIWNIMMDHSVSSDLALSGLFMVLFGSATAVGLLGGAAAGAMTSAVFVLTRKFAPNGGRVAVPEKPKKIFNLNQGSVYAKPVVYSGSELVAA
jgi:ABC-type glucose/galactose transport system permease subunit